MAFVTRLTKTPQLTQEWVAAELAPNDILGVWESLGFKMARNVTIVSKGGPSIVRFNVVDRIYQDQRGLNSWIPYAGSYKCPNLIAEVIQPRTDHFIDNGATWQAGDLQVYDIQIMQMAPLIVITVF